MNSGLVGFPSRPSRRARLSRVDALDGSIGVPITRAKSQYGTLDQLGVGVQIGAIRATAGLWAIAYCPLDDRLYACAKTADGQVVVVNPARQLVEQRFHVGANPISITYVPTTRRLLFLRTDGTIVVYDPVRRVVVRTVVSGVATPTAIAWCPTNGLVYVAGSASAAASFNPTTWTTTALAIAVGGAEIAYDPVGDNMVIASAGGMGVIICASNTSVGILTAGSTTHYLCVSPHDRIHGFANGGTGALLICRGGTMTAETDTIVQAGVVLGAAAYSPTSQRVYFGRGDIGTAGGVQLYTSAFDGRRINVSAAPLTCGNPRGMAYCPSDQRMYAVSDAGAPEIAVIS